MYMQNEFVGKTALIVGGGSGIGKATAKMLLERGGSVIIVGRNADKLKMAEGELSQLGPVTTLQTDITNSDQLESLLVKLDGQFSDVNLLVKDSTVFILLAVWAPLMMLPKLFVTCFLTARPG